MTTDASSGSPTSPDSCGYVERIYVSWAWVVVILALLVTVVSLAT